MMLRNPSLVGHKEGPTKPPKLESMRACFISAACKLCLDTSTSIFVKNGTIKLFVAIKTMIYPREGQWGEGRKEEVLFRVVFHLQGDADMQLLTLPWHCHHHHLHHHLHHLLRQELGQGGRTRAS